MQEHIDALANVSGPATWTEAPTALEARGLVIAISGMSSVGLRAGVVSGKVSRAQNTIHLVAAVAVAGRLLGGEGAFKGVSNINTMFEGFERDSPENHLMGTVLQDSLDAGEWMVLGHALVAGRMTGSSHRDVCTMRAQATAGVFPVDIAFLLTSTPHSICCDSALWMPFALLPPFARHRMLLIIILTDTPEQLRPSFRLIARCLISSCQFIQPVLSGAVIPPILVAPVFSKL